MLISGFVKSSLVDFPGRIACVLFLSGCNYNCFYCHNRDLIDGSNKNFLDNDEIKSFLIKRKNLLDGVVITGGEPTLQKDLIVYMQMIKELGYDLKLDTNGSNPQVIENVLKNKICDYFAVDYKAPSSKYQEACNKNVNSEDVIKTINLLLEYKADFEVRTTVYPQLSLNDLTTMAKELPIVPKYVLNRFRKPETFLIEDTEHISQTPYTKNEISDFVNTLKHLQPNIIS